MLSRTAENLFWIARYIERAETMARLLEVGARIALMPSAGHGYRSEWESLLQASGTAAGFAAKYGDPVQRNIERITAAIAARRAGDLVSYYQWVVETTSDVPAIRDAYLEALALADADRQPYDEALALTSERWAELDWLATLRRT